MSLRSCLDEEDWAQYELEKLWDEYRKIFKRADFDDGVTRPGNDVIVMIWSWGIVPAGASISYVHCGPPPKESIFRSPACVEQKETGSGMYGNSSSFGYRYKKLTDKFFHRRRVQLTRRKQESRRQLFKKP
jgi:hypothetical protein